MKKHLAIFQKSFLDLILEGEKTIESRFSQKKIAPYGQVNIGDIVLMKKSGKKKVFGEFTVQNVLEFEELNSVKLEEIKEKYGKSMCASAGQYFWEKRSQAKFATLIFISEVKKYSNYFSFSKKDRRS